MDCRTQKQAQTDGKVHIEYKFEQQVLVLDLYCI